MGLFSGVWEGIRRAGRAVVSAAKTIASKAIDFMANRAESFVGKVKEVWKKVKPYVEKAQAPLRRLAQKTKDIPYVGQITSAISIGVDGLLALENSPVLKKVEAAIKSVAEKARTLEAKIKNGEIPFLTAAEYKEAVKSRSIFRSVEDDVVASRRKDFDIASAINDLLIVKTDLQTAIDGEPADFEHYLRLRATQKLLRDEESKLTASGSLDALSENDWFLIRVASDLIKADPELSTQAAERVDIILKEKGKSLQSFVYEELIAAWKVDSVALASELDVAQGNLAKDIVLLRRLNADKKIQNELSKEDTALLERLEVDVPRQERSVDALAANQRDVERYANAAEGFLQMLEKSPEQLEAEDRAYVLDEGNDVGKIIVEVAEKKIPFKALTQDDQALITDFANVFKKEASKRMEILEVAA